MRVFSLEDGRPIILLERNEIKPTMRILNLIRLKTKVGEQQRTWALIKLECLRRWKSGLS